MAVISFMIPVPGYVAIMNVLICPIQFNINLFSISNKLQFKEFGSILYFIQDQKTKMNETETEVKNYSIAYTYNNATQSA